MERIIPVDTTTAHGKAKELLDVVKNKLGIVPNMTRAMAVSPAVLEGYLGLERGTQSRRPATEATGATGSRCGAGERMRLLRLGPLDYRQAARAERTGDPQQP